VSRGTRALRVQLPEGRVAPRIARRAVAELASDLRALDRADLVVLTSEVTTAMVTDDAEPLALEVWRTDRGFRVEVRSGSVEHAFDGVTTSLLERLASTWYASEGVAGFEVHAPVMFAASQDDAAMFARLAEGDDAARAALAERYAYLARAIARRFVRSGIPREDLEQVAAMGLTKAMERFDMSRGVRFTTFAARTIEGELKRHLRDSGWSLRVPRSLQELGLDAARTSAGLSQRNGREPTLREVSASLGEDAAEVGQALLARRSFTAASLDAPTEGAESFRLLDALPSHDERLEIAPEWADLSSVIDGLPVRERRILYLRFFEDLSQSEIAARVGVSQMHVSRLLAKSIARLRELIGGDEEGGTPR
jgi:RNA polymerase sigma-B factor